MHKSVYNLIQIEKEIQSNIINLDTTTKSPKIIAVSKTHPMASILPLINHGHLDFGENKVQEAIDKWSDIKNKKNSMKLHLIGRLQTNKVKFALKIFDYIHSLDSEKLATKIANEQIKQEKKPKIFIHLTDNYKPTSGCVALIKKDFEILLKLIDQKTKIKIG